MGRDNSPKERQQLERKKQGRCAGYAGILIVSEGHKTEPLYLDEIRINQRLPTANIAAIPSECAWNRADSGRAVCEGSV